MDFVLFQKAGERGTQRKNLQGGIYGSILDQLELSHSETSYHVDDAVPGQVQGKKAWCLPALDTGTEAPAPTRRMDRENDPYCQAKSSPPHDTCFYPSLYS